VVIASNPEVAAWAAGPFSSGMVTMCPLVITPAHFPPITDPEEAKRSLERTFLSGLVHATEPVAADIGRALLAALDAAPDDVGLRYWDTLLAVLGDAIRSTLEMEMKDWEPKSDWGKRWLANIQREGRTEGRTEDRAASIVELLEVRGIPLDPPLHQRITSCTDYDVLTQWFRRAATATVAEELFAS
jgi:hypothetical protein